MTPSSAFAKRDQKVDLAVEESVERIVALIRQERAVDLSSSLEGLLPSPLLRRGEESK